MFFMDWMPRNIFMPDPEFAATGGLGAIRAGGVFLHHRADIGQGPGAQGQCGRQPGGHTFLHLAVCNGADAFHRAVAGSRNIVIFKYQSKMFLLCNK